MIFVSSVGGINHSPKNLTKPVDMMSGTNVLSQTTLELICDFERGGSRS